MLMKVYDDSGDHYDCHDDGYNDDWNNDCDKIMFWMMVWWWWSVVAEILHLMTIVKWLVALKILLWSGSGV